MTVLGVDFGLRTTGLALSDPHERIAFPAGSVHGDEAECIRRIVEEAEAHRAAEIVVGMPRHLDGRESDMSARAATFARKLSEAVSAKVVTWDERLTSREADRAMLSGDLSRRKRKKRIDALAAQLMLQSYLDSRRRSR